MLILHAASRFAIPGWVIAVAIASVIWPAYVMFSYRAPWSLWHFSPLLFLPLAILVILIRIYGTASRTRGRFRQQLELESIRARQSNLDARRQNAREIKSVLSFVTMVFIFPAICVFFVVSRFRTDNSRTRAVILSLAVAIPVLWYIYLRFKGKRDESLPADACPVCGYDMRATPARCPECGFQPPSYRGRNLSVPKRNLLDLRGKRLKR